MWKGQKNRIDIQKAICEPALSSQKQSHKKGSFLGWGLCCFLCESTTSLMQRHSWNLLTTAAHSATRAVLMTSTSLLDCTCTWRNTITNTYKSWVCIVTANTTIHAHRCMHDYIHDNMHFVCVNVFVHIHAGRDHVFAWAGQGSFLSLFFIEWEKAVSNFVLSTAGRCFSAVSCNLFQLCVLIIACSWWYSSKKKKKIRAFLFNKPFPLSRWHLMTDCRFAEREKKKTQTHPCLLISLITAVAQEAGRECNWKGSVHWYFSCGERERALAQAYIKNFSTLRETDEITVKDFCTPTCFLWNLTQKIH